MSAVLQAIDDFDAWVEKLHGLDRKEYLEGVRERIKELESEEDDTGEKNKAVMMNSIRDQLRDSLPITATTKTENITYPTVGQYSKMDPKTVIHVDAFLYDDDLYDDLCDEGKLSRNYCLDCGSRKVKPLTVLTHSASVTQIKYMFEFLLGDLKGKTLLDVGSRTGAVLYGAYLYSCCPNIVGVEIDPTFCKLQKQIVTDYSFQKRIKIYQDDILNNLHLISESDVVILNNVFEFFSSKEQQIRLWRAVSTALRKPGITVVSVPSIEESLETLGIGNELTTDWLVPRDVSEDLEAAKHHYFKDDPDNDELDNIFVYVTVKP